MITPPLPLRDSREPGVAHSEQDNPDPQLQQRLGEALRTEAPPPPPGLEARVRAMSARPVVDPKSAPNPWRRRVLYLAAAAVLAIVLLRFMPIGQPELALAADSPVSRETAEGLVRTHEMCRELSTHGSKRGGIDLGPIRRPSPDDGHDHTASAASRAVQLPAPDLSSIGYEHVGTKPCGYPYQNTAHLLYRHTASGKALSLFVQPDDEAGNLSTDHLYAVTSAGAKPALLAWRTGGRTWFLVADDDGQANAIASHLLTR